MNTAKRKDTQKDDSKSKRIKKECDYGEKCYRRNPTHLREFTHHHLEAILDTYTGSGDYPIPAQFSMDRLTITEQLDVLVEKQIYTPWTVNGSNVKDSKLGDNLPITENNGRGSPKRLDRQTNSPKLVDDQRISPIPSGSQRNSPIPSGSQRNLPIPSGSQRNSPIPSGSQRNSPIPPGSQRNSPIPSGSQRNSPIPSGSQSQDDICKKSHNTVEEQKMSLKAQQDEIRERRKMEYERHKIKNEIQTPKVKESLRVVDGDKDKTKDVRKRDSDYRPIVPPTRRVESYLNVCVPQGKMAAKHAASAPYHIFYTTITAAKETHRQPYSITFQEILDRSLGELKCSLQINFMVEIGWLLAQYYFAGYSEKRLTILYGEDCADLKNISSKKPQVDAHHVRMATPFGTHHTKIMLLCYEDGSLRVVVSTANLYLDDWENRVQGLWFSPSCPELPPAAMPHDGESPTMFKRSLLRYLSHYHSPALSFYTERVKRCDFSKINVFLVASAPGSHFDTDWGLTRVGSLLRQHCAIPPTENRRWPLIAQASSLGSYGNSAGLWLTGDFLHHFTKIKEQPQTLQSPPELKLIYPSLENVKQSHDGILGGGCLPYGSSTHSKQTWLNNYLYQWRARCTYRDRAMPHIKSYTRVSPDGTSAAYFLLTSGNCSKAAWGSINKGNAALRIMSYEAGVLFLPRFVINEELFPLSEHSSKRLVLPYDVPPTKYTEKMSPWVSDYLN